MATFSVKGLVVTIDEADVALVSQFHWCLQARGSRYVIGYPRGRRRDGLVYLHRLLMNAPRGMVVDHINGDPLDNRRANLRVCTQRQNSQNIRKPASKSGYVGVYFNKPKWVAEIKFDGVRHRLGRFGTKEDAAAAYAAKARELRGEFAATNDPSR